MRRSALISSVALTALAAVGACTQNFDQFDSSHYEGPGATGSGGGGGGPATTSSTTATSTTSGTTTTSTTTATTTTSTGAGAEDCLNGVDDDGDGDSDCGDSDCGAYACVEIPQPWQGPGVLYDGPPDQLPDCPGDLPTAVEVGGVDLVDEPATCSACSCGAPDVTCDATLTAYRSNSCDTGGPNTDFAVSSAIACTPFSGVGFQARSYRATEMTPSAGPCPPAGGVATLPPPAWTTQGRFCTRDAASAGCGAGEQCAPREVAPPFEHGLCVFRDGEHDCPRGYDVQHVFVKDFSDTRACTACQCDAPQAECAFATTTIYADPACAFSLENAPNDGSCLGNTAAGRSFSVNVTATGSCNPSGGDPIGEVSESADRTTVCCTR